MIINVILFSLIGISCLTLGVLLYRKVPVLTSLSEDEIAILNRKKTIVGKLKEIDYKEHWLKVIVFLEKFLWKIKIIFIKIENLLGKCIQWLRMKSQIMTQKSKDWIRWREMKRRSKEELEDDGEVSLNISKVDEEEEMEEMIEKDAMTLSDLKKPLKEEQKWIDLIVENPKNITAYKFLGLLYWKQHNYADAKASLEMAVKLGSKDKKVLEALEELKKSEEKE